MLLSGLKTLNIYPQTGNVFFSGDVLLSGALDTLQIDFSGSNQNLLSLSFQNDKIYCDSKFVDNYLYGTKIDFSGYIGQETFDLFIDGSPIAIGRQRNTGSISSIIAYSNQAVDFGLNISGKQPSYNISFPNFYLSTGNLTGEIVSQDGLPFRILSGSLQNSYFSISIPGRIS